MAIKKTSRQQQLQWPLVLASLGVVFGDIGTSPLYALRECFSSTVGLDVSEHNVVGVVSLFIWSLIVVVSIKYLLLVMRADNNGEGGILALLALVQSDTSRSGPRTGLMLFWLGVIGAGFIFGDGVITPAISVLSAVEGLEVVTPALSDLVIPITMLILLGLFIMQKRGAGRLGDLFGPVTLIWFLSLSVLGLRGILMEPQILQSFNPLSAAYFLYGHGTASLVVLGAVFLCVTGTEALYADMGHFGAKPIRYAWSLIVFPALALNYMGQGALLLTDASASDHPFFKLAPPQLLLSLVALATLSTIIASQALISGVFSLTSQAIQLGLLPRMTVLHTSKQHRGQIYISRINWILLVLTLWLVLEFKTSGNLAIAYGIAVCGTMLITTAFLYYVMRNRWGWSLPLAMGITVLFAAVDLTFFGANLLKIRHGGWLPLAFAAGVFTLMTTWRRGRQILRSRLEEKLSPLEVFVHDIPEHAPLRVPGTAIYMSLQPDLSPSALVYNLRHNHVVHDLVLIVHVVTKDTPHVSPMSRAECSKLADGIYRVHLNFGFMDEPDVPRALELIKGPELDFESDKATYFLGRENLIATPRPGMAIWRENLFGFLSRNAQKASRFFRIRADQVVEIGFEVEL